MAFGKTLLQSFDAFSRDMNNDGMPDKWATIHNPKHTHKHEIHKNKYMLCTTATAA